MRYSYQREIIKQVVFSADTHPTAEWVYNSAKRLVPNLSLGTVYRNLKFLEKAGDINVITDGLIARYDCNTEPHNHLKCKVCRDLIDVQLFDQELVSKVKRRYNFIAHDVEMTIVGTCSKHKVGK